MLRSSVRIFATKVLPPLIVFFAAALALELYVRLRHVPMYYMPRPTDVLRTLLDAQQRARLLSSLLVTTEAAPACAWRRDWPASARASVNAWSARWWSKKGWASKLSVP